jgi:hypothetical protein
MRSEAAVKGVSGYPGRRAPGHGGESSSSNKPLQRRKQVKRTVLLAALAALGVMLVAAAAASAKPTVKTCTTNSKNVTTKTVKGTVTASNVDPSQARFATCGTVKKVMNNLLSLRIEEPKIYLGFNCTPTVVHTAPDIVNYKCVFKGADTATFIKLTFTAKYDQD